jgi:hypothetical protein
MDQKEDLISQHDTLKSVRRSYSSKLAYIRGKGTIWWHMLSTDCYCRR